LEILLICPVFRGEIYKDSKYAIFVGLTLSSLPPGKKPEKGNLNLLNLFIDV
jgi:hypothetical protein